MTLKIELPDWEVDKKALAEIIDKMQAIEWNIETFEPLECPTRHIDVEIDISNQYDEFYLVDNRDGKVVKTIEVVTRNVAISNEKEWLNDINYTDEDRKSYKLGKVMSYYQRVGKSKYWYREL